MFYFSSTVWHIRMNMVSSLKQFSLEAVINQMPGFFGIYDLNSKFLLVNKSGAKWTGYQSPEAMIGHTYVDLPCKAAEDHALFLQQDKLALANGNIKFLGYYCYAGDDWKIVLGEKTWLKNSQNEVVGILCTFNDYTQSRLIDLSRFLMGESLKSPMKIGKKQFCYTLEGHFKKNIFSQRELECLFFLLRGKTAKTIAKMLLISHRTVEDHCEQIKFKLECQTKSEVIEKAISLGFFNILPKSLLNTFSPEISI
jgi:DNA-binding CsgD family transcriptional regulator